MKNITLKQLKSDFNYLEDSLSDYAVNEDTLVNVVHRELISGEMDLRGYMLWCIKDIVDYVTHEIAEDEDIEFLKTDKRAIRILKRYDIDVE